MLNHELMFGLRNSDSYWHRERGKPWIHQACGAESKREKDRGECLFADSSEILNSRPVTAFIYLMWNKQMNRKKNKEKVERLKDNWEGSHP